MFGSDQARLIAGVEEARRRNALQELQQKYDAAWRARDGFRNERDEARRLLAEAQRERDEARRQTAEAQRQRDEALAEVRATKAKLEEVNRLLRALSEIKASPVHSGRSMLDKFSSPGVTFNPISGTLERPSPAPSGVTAMPLSSIVLTSTATPSYRDKNALPTSTEVASTTVAPPTPASTSIPIPSSTIPSVRLWTPAPIPSHEQKLLSLVRFMGFNDPESKETIDISAKFDGRKGKYQIEVSGPCDKHGDIKNALNYVNNENELKEEVIPMSLGKFRMTMSIENILELFSRGASHGFNLSRDEEMAFKAKVRVLPTLSSPVIFR